MNATATMKTTTASEHLANTTAQPTSVPIYHLDADNLFTTEGTAPIVLGDAIIPAHATTTAPPRAKPDHARQFDAATNTWEYVLDLRGQTVYDTQTREARTMDTVGALPDGVTLDAPGAHDTWDGQTNQWITDDAAMLADAVAARRAEVEGVMRDVLAAGCTHQGSRFDGTEADGARVQNALALAHIRAYQNKAFAPMTWTTADNAVYAITTLAELEALSLAINERIAAAFAARNRHKAAIAELGHIPIDDNPSDEAQNAAGNARSKSTAGDSAEPSIPTDPRARLAVLAAYDIMTGWPHDGDKNTAEIAPRKGLWQGLRTLTSGKSS